MSKSLSQPILKLDFNERSDRLNPLVDEFGFGESLWQYPDREPLEAKIADLNQLSPKQVLCTNGGDEAIMILMRLCTELASKNKFQLILPLPAFSQYTWGVKSWNIDARIIPSNNNFSININKTLEEIKASSQSITILTRPNNPTGESIKTEDLIALITASKNANGWVFLDEAYAEFSQNESAVKLLLKQFDNLIILRTFSKAHGLAGIRLGYLLGSENLIDAFKLRCMPFNISTPSLQIAMAALNDKNQKAMQQYCSVIKNNRIILSNWLSEASVQFFPSEANFLLIKLPSKQAPAVLSFLARNKILVRSFVEPELKDCLRITVPFHIDRLLDKLKQCLAPELVCFDMDGVLIDTSGSYDQCVIETVKYFSKKITNLKTIEDLRKRGGFNNDWVLSQQLLSDLNIDVSLEDVTNKFQEIYLGNEHQPGLVTNETKLISDALTRKINQNSQITFTVVTGRPRREALSGQKLTNLSGLDLISLDDVVEGKPSPEGIKKLQQKYSTRSWMCGDNPDDMQAAVASNSLAIGIGSNKVEALYQAGADIVLNEINELESWLCLK